MPNLQFLISADTDFENGTRFKIFLEPHPPCSQGRPEILSRIADSLKKGENVFFLISDFPEETEVLFRLYDALEKGVIERETIETGLKNGNYFVALTIVR